MGAISGEDAIAIANQYTDESLAGAGAVAGVPCQIQSITDITGGHRVIFLWVDNNGDSHTSSMDVLNGVDGKGIKAVTINEENHLIITYSDDTTSDAGKIEIQSAVDSVNGKTGAVTLDASDVGALPDDTAIPTKTSNLTNDSGFITKAVNDLVNYYLKSETYSKTEVDGIVTAIKNSRFEYVATLPTTDIKTNVIYLVPKSPSQTSNVKDEYINLDGTTSGWEKIGDTDIDLSGYVTTQALNTALAAYTTTDDLTTLLAGKQDTLTFDNVPTENSNNPVKSNGLYVGNRNIYEVMGQNGAKNKEPFDIDVVKALNTTGTWTGNSYELNGITFAFADDGKVTVSGTASALCSINISGNYDLNGDYIITGCPSGGGGSTYSLRVYDSSATTVADDVGEGISFTANNLANCRTNLIVRKDVAISTPIVFAPMIRDSKDTDDTYVPYAKTNRQLTEETTALLDNLEVNGAVNMCKNNAVTQTTTDGTTTFTWTVNDDGTVTVSAPSYPVTLASSTYVELWKNITADECKELVGKTLKCTGCPSGGGSDKYRISLYRVGTTDGSTGTNATVEDDGDGVVFTWKNNGSGTKATIYLELRPNYEMTGPLTFKPMITVPSYNGDYVPYAKSNRELTENVTSLDAMYDGKAPSAVSDLNVPLTAGGATVAFTRHLNNSTNAPTNGGGLEITWSSSDKYGAQLTLTDGGLYFRTNNNGTISAWQKIST